MLGPRRPDEPHHPPLGPEWDHVTSADDRLFLERALSAPAAPPGGSPPPQAEARAERYRRLLARAWYAETLRERARVDAVNEVRLEAHAAAVADWRSRRVRACLPTPSEWLEVGASVALAVGLTFGFRRWQAVRVHADGVRIGRRWVAWERIEHIDWYAGTVELRLVDGAVWRTDGLALPEAAVPAAEAATAGRAGRPMQGGV